MWVRRGAGGDTKGQLGGAKAGGRYARGDDHGTGVHENIASASCGAWGFLSEFVGVHGTVGRWSAAPSGGVGSGTGERANMTVQPAWLAQLGTWCLGRCSL